MAGLYCTQQDHLTRRLPDEPWHVLLSERNWPVQHEAGMFAGFSSAVLAYLQNCKIAKFGYFLTLPSPQCGRHIWKPLGYVLFGPQRTGLALPWTTYYRVEDCLNMLLLCFRKRMSGARARVHPRIFAVRRKPTPLLLWTAFRRRRIRLLSRASVRSKEGARNESTFLSLPCSFAPSSYVGPRPTRNGPHNLLLQKVGIFF